MRVKSLLAVAIALGSTAGASAHNTYLEEQITLPRGLAKKAIDPNPVNLSFLNAFDLTQPLSVVNHGTASAPQYQIDPENGTLTQLGGLLTSRAVFGHLDNWKDNAPDLDVFTFTITPGVDLAQAQQVPAVASFAAQGLTVAIATPIPPACTESKNDYPAIALSIPCSFMIDANGKAIMTPFGPSQTMFIGPGSHTLPFPSTAQQVFTASGIPVTIYTAPSVDNGPYAPPTAMCVAQVAYNIPSDNRIIFNEPHTGAAWFLPTGCSVTPFFDCSGAPGIFYPLPAMLPFPYKGQYIVWNTAQDNGAEDQGIPYTLSSGIGEGARWIAENPEVENFVTNNDWTVNKCTAAQ